jgi:hypothetical protein
MTTVTAITNRFGEPMWAVKWGPGLTQTAICRTTAEATAVKRSRRAAGGSVEPLVGLRAY